MKDDFFSTAHTNKSDDNQLSSVL